MSIAITYDACDAVNRGSGSVPFAVIKMNRKLRSLIRRNALRVSLNKDVIVLGDRYDFGLFEIRDKISWPVWINKVINNDNIKKLFERVSFGNRTMFRISEELIKYGWRISGFSPYGDNDEIIDELQPFLDDPLEKYKEFFIQIYSREDLFFGIRTISLEKVDEEKGIDIDGLTSTIVIFDNRRSITDTRYKDLLSALNKVLKESR